MWRGVDVLSACGVEGFTKGRALFLWPTNGGSCIVIRFVGEVAQSRTKIGSVPWIVRSFVRSMRCYCEINDCDHQRSFETSGTEFDESKGVN